MIIRTLTRERVYLCSVRMELMFVISLIILTSALQSRGIREPETETEYIICRQCGADIADSYYLYNELSPQTFQVFNQTLVDNADVKAQVLINPYGIKFNVINTSKASCSGVGDWQNADSWYPGFAWRHCVCPHCGTHLGWVFEPVESLSTDKSEPSEARFYALNLDNILSDKCEYSENFDSLFSSGCEFIIKTVTDSLLILPKLMRS